jgi:hypothetical protein
MRSLAAITAQFRDGAIPALALPFSITSSAVAIIVPGSSPELLRCLQIAGKLAWGDLASLKIDARRRQTPEPSASSG